MPKGQIPLEFAFDVSGSPGSNTYFGMVSLKRSDKDTVIDELFDKYPQFEKPKGRQLRKEDHLSVIRFLDSMNVRMRVLRFTANDWAYQRRQWQGAHELNEKVSAVLYFAVLLTVGRPDSRYSVISCVESQLGDITRVTHHCRRLASMHKIDLDCYHATDSTNRSVKVADIIAASGRTLSPNDVKGIKGYRFVWGSKVKKKYFKTVFS